MARNTFTKKDNSYGIRSLLLPLIFVSLLLSLTLQVSAASDDYSVSFQKDVSICSCNSFKGDFVVQNNPDYVTMFTISVSGDNGLIKGIIPNFVLSPGSDAKFTEMIDIPCDFSGDMNVTFSILGGSVSNNYVQHISAGKCSPAKLYAAVPTKTVQPCSRVDYSVLLENTASYAETFEVSASDYEEYSKNSYSFTLEPNKIANLNLSYKFSCDINGNLTLPFKVHAVNTDYDIESNLNLNIIPNYPFEVQTAQKVRQCVESDGKYPVTIKNQFNPKLTLDERKSINASGFTMDIVPILPDVFSAEPQKVKNQLSELMSSIVRHEVRTFSVPFNSQVETKIIVDARSEKENPLMQMLIGKELRYSVFITENNGMTRKEFPITVTLDNCNSFDFNLGKNNATVCSRMNKYEFFVKNTGKDAFFVMSLDAKDSGAILSPDRFYLKKDEVKKGFLLLNTNASETGKFDLLVSASMYAPYAKSNPSKSIDQNDMSSENKELLDTKSLTFSLDILPEDKCYGLDIKLEKKRTEGSVNISVLLVNTGLYTENVSLSISNGNDFSFMSPDQFESKTLDGIILVPSEKKTLNIVFDPADYSSYGFYTTYLNADAIGLASDADSTFEIFASGKSIVSYERKDSYLHRSIFLFAILLVLGFFIGMFTWRRKVDFALIIKVILFSFAILALVILAIGFFYFIAVEYILLVMSAFLGGIWSFFFGRFVLRHQDTRKKGETKKTSKTKKMIIHITKTVFGVLALCVLIGLLIVNPQYIDLVLKAAIFVLTALFLIKITQVVIRTLKIGVKKETPAQITVAPVQTKIVEKVVEKIVYVDRPVQPKKTILKKSIPKKEKKISSSVKNKIKLFLLYLLMFAFLFLVFNVASDVKTRAQESVKFNETFLNQTMYVNEPKVLDMSMNFKDPDNDSLKYVISSKNGLLYSKSSKNQITIYARDTGNDSAVIYANDSRGGSVMSPEINFRIVDARFNVLEVLILSFLNSFGLLNLMLLVIVLILSGILVYRIVILRKRKKEAEEKERLAIQKKSSRKKSKTKK